MPGWIVTFFFHSGISFCGFAELFFKQHLWSCQSAPSHLGVNQFEKFTLRPSEWGANLTLSNGDKGATSPFAKLTHLSACLAIPPPWNLPRTPPPARIQHPSTPVSPHCPTTIPVPPSRTKYTPPSSHYLAACLSSSAAGSSSRAGKGLTLICIPSTQH